MSRLLAILVLLSSTAALCQQPAANAAPPPASTFTVRSTLVVVPALVRTKGGELVFTLKASDFHLTDNGITQRLTLEDNTDQQPLALVICVQTGSVGAAHLADYKALGPLLDAVIGAVPHQVALVGFDAQPVLLHGFTPNTDYIAHSLDLLDPGQPGDPATRHAAILDALVYSVDLLRQQPTTYRRAVILLSETVDDGSHNTLEQALHAISDTNTAIYSFSFGSTGARIGQEAAKLSSDEPGPQHGCFSRDYGTDADGKPIPPPETRTTQDYDCIAELLPPLRLGKIAEIAARNAMRRNISASVAQLTGGEHYKFSDARALQKELFTLSNHIPNRYVLSFHPQTPSPGFHTIELTLPDYTQLRIEARNGYWVDADGQP